MGEKMPAVKSIIDLSLSSSSKKPRQVFVAYSYRLYDKKDYRRPFKDIGKAFDINFVFADEKISSMHILQKIADHIRESQFGIYDVSGWNPNVTLELGLALGMGERVFIALNPDKTEVGDLPSDLKGMDRLQYTSFSALEEELGRLISQELPPTKPTEEDFLSSLQHEIVTIIKQVPGMSITNIAKAVGQNKDLVKLAVHRELGKRIERKGERRGAKYYPLEL